MAFAAVLGITLAKLVNPGSGASLEGWKELQVIWLASANRSSIGSPKIIGRYSRKAAAGFLSKSLQRPG